MVRICWMLDEYSLTNQWKTVKSAQFTMARTAHRTRLKFKLWRVWFFARRLAKVSRRGVPSGSRQTHPGVTCICIRALFGLVVATWWLFYIIMISLYSWYAQVHTCQRLSSSLDWLGKLARFKLVGDGEELHSGDGTIHDSGHRRLDHHAPNWYSRISNVPATYL